MKNTIFRIPGLLLICLLQLTLFEPVTAADRPHDIPSFTGTYVVDVITQPHNECSTKIGIEDLKNGKVKVTGNFDGMPVTVIGSQTETATAEPVYIFKINIPRLCNGKAIMRLKYQNHNYKMFANANGTYDYQGISGQGSAKITGQRISTSLPVFGMAAISSFLVSKFKLAGNFVSWIGPTLIVILLLTYFLIRYQRKHAASRYR